MERPEGMDDLEFAEIRRQVEEAAARSAPVDTPIRRAGDAPPPKPAAPPRQPSKRQRLDRMILIVAGVAACLFVLLIVGVLILKMALPHKDPAASASNTPPPTPATSAPDRPAEAPMLLIMPRLGEPTSEVIGKMGEPSERFTGKDYMMPYDERMGWDEEWGRVWVTIYQGKVVEVTAKPPVDFFRFNALEDTQRWLNYMARESIWHELSEPIYGCHLQGYDGDRLGEIQRGFIRTTMFDWERYQEKNY